MQHRKIGRYIALTVFGAILVTAGVVGFFLLSERGITGYVMPYIGVGIGIGAGIFGGSLAKAIIIHRFRKDPQFAKQAQIDAEDERSKIIREKAKAKAYDFMQYGFAAMLLLSALLGVSPPAMLALTALYLAMIFVNIYHLAKLQKEM